MKQEIEQIKEELSSEEKFFEGFFKIEQFVKKYKIQLIIIGVALVVVFVGTNVNDYLNKQKLIKTNVAYNNILQNKNINKNLTILKENSPTLYKIALYKLGKKDIIDLEYLKDLTTLQNAFKNKDIKLIDSLILSSDMLLKDYALFYKAVILTDKKQYKDAKKTLEFIKSNSKVAQFANSLKHYLLTKE